MFALKEESKSNNRTVSTTNYSILLIWFFLFTFYHAYANERGPLTTLDSAAAPKILSAESLTQKLPEDFQGLLYNCEPLCRFIAIKNKQNWNPPLNKIKISVENPSWVLSSSPLYPLLIRSSPVKPFVSVQPEKENVSKKNAENAPIPPPVPFDYGYGFALGLRAMSGEIDSSSVPQENVSPTSLIQSPTTQISLFRLKPILFFSRWFQLRMMYESDFSGSSEMRTGQKINQSATDLHIDVLLMNDTSKWMFRSGQLATNYQTDLNVLSSYSFSENWFWVGVGYIKNRFQFTADYGLSVNLSEEQDFRDQLQDAKFYRIAAQWCSSTQDISDIKYGVCVNLSKKHSTTASDIKSSFSMSEKLTVQTDENQLQLLLRFGDDFYL